MGMTQRTLVIDGNKVCTGCDEAKSIDEFPKSRSGRDGISARCRKCHADARRAYRQRTLDRHREVDRAYYARNREKARDYNLRKRYGISSRDYDRMLAWQCGLCHLCRKPPTGRYNGGVLHADHDHQTGRLRRLICHDCNNGLGRFKDDPDLLRRAAAYIEEFR